MAQPGELQVEKLLFGKAPIAWRQHLPAWSEIPSAASVVRSTRPYTSRERDPGWHRLLPLPFIDPAAGSGSCWRSKWYLLEGMAKGGTEAREGPQPFML